MIIILFAHLFQRWPLNINMPWMLCIAYHHHHCHWWLLTDQNHHQHRRSSLIVITIANRSSRAAPHRHQWLLVHAHHHKLSPSSLIIVHYSHHKHHHVLLSQPSWLLIFASAMCSISWLDCMRTEIKPRTLQPPKKAQYVIPTYLGICSAPFMLKTNARWKLRQYIFQNIGSHGRSKYLTMFICWSIWNPRINSIQLPYHPKFVASFLCVSIIQGLSQHLVNMRNYEAESSTHSIHPPTALPHPTSPTSLHLNPPPHT